MSDSVVLPAQPSRGIAGGVHVHLPTLPEALASLLRTVVVALFVITFLLQPFLIPSESMERTLLVGDFLLFNKQVYAPAGPVGKWLMPYRSIRRGDIIVFHHPRPSLLVKRVIGVPGDLLRIQNGKVYVNGVLLDEPYAAYEPAPPNDFRDNFPPRIYSDPQVDPDWWREMQSLTHNGELRVPAGEYFVLGDNRNHSNDSRYWGLVPRQAVVARPLVIYFSLRRPSTTDVQPAPLQAADDKLGHDRDFSVRLADFARWKRIFRVIH
ncbi:MAG TPA: signal peptidase I [Terracidiphilus sp.]|jgi:signal peptidase I|nr:signal peptidase I [Terracidiphilus sp.]